MATITELDSRNFSAATAGKTPVLVDFWAEWCGPCRTMSAVLDQVAGTLDGRVQLAKVNVDDEPELADRYRVQGIPTVILFTDGREVDRVVGAVPKHALETWVLAHTPEPRQDARAS
jgi:thioredoxin 1